LWRSVAELLAHNGGTTLGGSVLGEEELMRLGDVPNAVQVR